MKSLKKRVTEGELVVVQTDKTGKFCVMSREAYLRAGQVHTEKDTKVDLSKVAEIQKDINGNIAMLIKFFRFKSRVITFS